MFLDEELLQIAKEAYTPTGSREISKNKMLYKCYNNIHSNLHTCDRQEIRANFKRVDNTWIKVVRQLNNEGIFYLNEGDFKEEMKEEMKKHKELKLILE